MKDSNETTNVDGVRQIDAHEVLLSQLRFLSNTVDGNFAFAVRNLRSGRISRECYNDVITLNEKLHDVLNDLKYEYVL